MGFRTVVIKSRAKLETRLNYLVVRGEEEKKVFLSEINILIVQSTAVSLTASLLCELTKRNIKVIFCDEKNNPQSELLPYYGAHNTSKRYSEQFNWDKETADKVWKEIIKRKIVLQGDILLSLGFSDQYLLLKAYEENVSESDLTNREGHAAKVYFNCILGENGSRRQGNFLNSCLNYGYAVVLSAINREIVASGYLTQIGIKHRNEFNEFNLGCDLMEIFRPYVDRVAIALPQDAPDFKRRMVSVLNLKTEIDNMTTTLDIAINVFVKSFFKCMSEKTERYLVMPDKVYFE